MSMPGLADLINQGGPDAQGKMTISQRGDLGKLGMWSLLARHAAADDPNAYQLLYPPGGDTTSNKLGSYRAIEDSEKGR